MCGLFGFLSYGKENIDLNDVTKELAIASQQRGVDATGIAYMLRNHVEIEKAPKPACQFKINLPKTTKAVIGHTRHSTQGSERKPYNNHPFMGQLKDFSTFALAHNGIITNDSILRKKHKLHKTKVETDSYIAVQLLEQKGSLTMDSLKYMAEMVSGSFSFSILDQRNNLYLIKGDSPLSILHFKELKLYVYASTDRILWQALIGSCLFEQLKGHKGEIVPIKAGQILKISSNGQLEYSSFDYDEYEGFGWWVCPKPRAVNTCFEELMEVAGAMGYAEEDIRQLCDYGFSYDEIEAFLYDPSLCEI